VRLYLFLTNLFMSDKLWKYFAYGWFAVQTVCIFILLEVILFRFPYISLFFLILGGTVYVNCRIFGLPYRQIIPLIKKNKKNCGAEQAPEKQLVKSVAT